MDVGHVLKTSGWTRQRWEQLFNHTEQIEGCYRRGRADQLLAGKILANLFFEPSTRTYFSFASAMLRLGGRVIGHDTGETLATAKGESLSDTGRVISLYADIIAVRHPRPGAVEELAKRATVPVINAGDGDLEHPTQALLDMYTLAKARRKLDTLTIGFVGDLKHGRAVHSLLELLLPYRPQPFFVAPPSTQLPESYREMLRAADVEYECVDDLEPIVPHLDVLYVTRPQKERWSGAGTEVAPQEEWSVTPATLEKARGDLMVLHPLPRNREIHPDCDELPQARYFEQAENGLYLRMGLLTHLLGISF